MPEALGALAARLLLAPLWAAAALVLPWLVRGRSLAVDIVGAATWAAGLAAATAAVADCADLAEPRGLRPARSRGRAGGAAAAGADDSNAAHDRA